MRRKRNGCITLVVCLSVMSLNIKEPINFNLSVHCLQKEVFISNYILYMYIKSISFEQSTVFKLWNVKEYFLHL